MYSWAPTMQKILAGHAAAADLDATVLANETVAEMMEHYRTTMWFDYERRDVDPETGCVYVERTFERETGGATNPVHFRLVNVPRTIELRPLRG